MTPGEVKGFAKQAMKRKVLTPEEKTAISLLLEMQEVMMEWAPLMSKIVKGIEHDKIHTSNDVAKSPGEGAEPNTGWKGNDLLPNRKGPK